ncbi:MAG: DSD1 family PLP-dependent enzyme [Anaerolineae bacterium]
MSYQPKPGTHYLELDTPALLLDLDAFQHNLNTMAQFFANKPTSLRPHAKTHKCPEIARRQIQAGAIGITCAKVGEAEVLARAGIEDILIANQIVGEFKIARLTDLAAHAELMVAVDDPANITALSRACQAKGVSLRVLVEVDIGMNRCGAQPGMPALGLAQQVADSPNLQLAGLMGYEGHLVSIVDPEERRARVLQALVPLQETRDLLEENGLPVEIVSGGGTGTYDVSGTYPPMTEIEAGSYVLMDASYIAVRPEFETALTILSSVISRPTPERVVTDAGMKTVTTDHGLPVPIEIPGASVRRLSEEHGLLELADPRAVQPRPGDKIRLIPGHCCTNVNLYDNLHVVQDGTLVDIWPVAARGRAQ